MKKLLIVTLCFIMFYNVGFSQDCGTEITQEQKNSLDTSYYVMSFINATS